MKKPVKLNAKIVSILEERLADEYTAHYFYQDAANYLQGIGYFSAAEYFTKESNDELSHARGIQKFLVDWNVHPQLPQIDASDNNFDGLIDVIEKAYEIEFQLYQNYDKDSNTILIDMGNACVFDFLQTYRNIQTASVAEYSDFLNLAQGVDVESKFEMLMLQEQLFND